MHLAAIHVLRLGLGNARAVSASTTGYKFGQNKLFKVTHKAGNCVLTSELSVILRVFAYVSLLAGVQLPIVINF